MLVDRIDIAVEKLRNGLPSRRTDRKADEKLKKFVRFPRNSDVLNLAAKINKAEVSGRKKTDIAREFTDWDETKTQSLLRSVPASPHLLLTPQPNPAARQAG